MSADEMKPRVRVERLDHLVLTVINIERTCEFYERVLGMKPVVFGDNRQALTFGSQKINLHQVGQEFEPKAAVPTPGSADLCFLTRTPLKEVIEHLRALEVMVEEGPVRRAGALGPIESVYVRDPNENLIEISNYSYEFDI
jgi:catechol 2,3-dioxygenase-like lactoylglutathione lyase family enzyme